MTQSITPPPPTSAAPPPQPSARDAKAHAKAAKAYEKAQRPWYKKKRFLVVIGLLLLVIVVAIAGSGGNDPDSTAQPANQEPAVEEPAAEAPAVEDPVAEEPVVEEPAAEAPVADAPAEAADPTVLADDGWEVDTFNIADDGIGDFSAAARIVNNTGGNVSGAIFTMTVLEAGNIVATLTGSASEVDEGGTATVEFFSTDDFLEGTFVYDFQVDMSY